LQFGLRRKRGKSRPHQNCHDGTHFVRSMIWKEEATAFSDCWNGMPGFDFLSVVSVRISPPKAYQLRSVWTFHQWGSLPELRRGSSLPFMRIGPICSKQFYCSTPKSRETHAAIFFPQKSLHRLYPVWSWRGSVLSLLLMGPIRHHE
jgi:hypothetical protein